MNPLLVCARRYSSLVPHHMKEFFEKRTSPADSFLKVFHDKYKVVSAPENTGTCLIKLTVDSDLININNVMHGGAISTLIDLVSTAALFNTTPRKPGVSVDLHVS